MARIRTINQAIDYLKSKDPNTAVSTWWLRTMIKTGKIKYHKAGNKFLIDLDILEEFLRNPPTAKREVNNEYGKLRKILD